MSATRTYKSPLREEQMEQTRERILEQVAEILSSNAPSELTVAAAAEAARVSVRTAYRYFPTKEALIDAFNAWMMNRFRARPYPDKLEDLPGFASELFRGFDANEALIRASTRSQHGVEIRKRRKLEQVKNITRLVAAAAPHLDALTLRKTASVLHQTVSADTWIHMRDNWGLSTEECIDATCWSIEALLAKLRKQDQLTERSRK